MCSSAGCLLYTDTFNSPPEVTVDWPVVVVKGKQQDLTATVHDREDGSQVRAEWFRRDVMPGETCPRTLAEARAAAEKSRTGLTGLKYPLLTDHYGLLCLWVVVTDKAGANAFAGPAEGRPFEVKNVAPTAMIELVSPAPLRWVGNAAFVSLYSQAHLSARASHDLDEDRLTYTWTINDEPVTINGCAGTAGETEICRTLDRPGDYRFALEVFDGTDRAKYVLPLSVMPDAPPCIQQTEPPFGLPRVVAFAAERTNIQVVEVGDDGDPFPARPGQPSQIAFVWRFQYVGSTEPPNRLVSTTMPAISFAPDTFRPGEEVDVRLDVLDRVVDRDFRACDGKAECELDAGSGCRQRVTWRVSFL